MQKFNTISNHCQVSFVPTRYYNVDLSCSLVFGPSLHRDSLSLNFVSYIVTVLSTSHLQICPAHTDIIKGGTIWRGYSDLTVIDAHEFRIVTIYLTVAILVIIMIVVKMGSRPPDHL